MSSESTLPCETRAGMLLKLEDEPLIATRNLRSVTNDFIILRSVKAVLLVN